jgi:cytochrome c-type biogenesis protein CcmH/NrfG
VLQGRLENAQQLLDEAAATMRERHVDEGATGALVHRLVQAQIWAAQGRSADAVTAFTGVLDSYTRLDCCSGPRSQVLVARATVRFKDRQLELAARDAEEALKFAQTAQGQLPSSSTTGEAWLMLAQIEQARGHADEAQRAYAQAVSNLVETLGEQHPDTVRARKGMSDT